jgi:hypothetical protein
LGSEFPAYGNCGKGGVGYTREFWSSVFGLAERICGRLKNGGSVMAAKFETAGYVLGVSLLFLLSIEVVDHAEASFRGIASDVARCKLSRE